MWTLQRNSSKRHSCSRKLGEKFCTGDEENPDIHTVENVVVYFPKLLQAIRTVHTEKASGLLTGQQVSKSAGLFVGTVI